MNYEFLSILYILLFIKELSQWHLTFNSQNTKTLQIEGVKIRTIVFYSDSSVV